MLPARWLTQASSCKKVLLGVCATCLPLGPLSQAPLTTTTAMLGRCRTHGCVQQATLLTARMFKRTPARLCGPGWRIRMLHGNSLWTCVIPGTYTGGCTGAGVTAATS